MDQEQIMQRIGSAYLALVHPEYNSANLAQDLQPIVEITPLVPDGVVSDMLRAGLSWRERVVALAVAVGKRKPGFIQDMIGSLSDPRGLAIVPACAAVVVATNSNAPDGIEESCSELDRNAFDGQMGWALEKMYHYLGLSEHDPPGNDPNDGQNFEAQLAMFRQMRKSAT